FQAVTSIDAALQGKPEAAVIATPTALHLRTAIPLARASCHLLLEEPVSHSMEEVKELQEAVREGGGKVMVAFQYRHHPGLLTVRRWLKDGAIGRPLGAHAHCGDYLPAWHSWEDYRQSYSARADLGGGVVLTLCHPLDYMLWLMGNVTQVAGMTTAEAGMGIGVEDSAQAALHFASGALGGVHLNYVQRPASHHLTVVGADGTITWDQSDGAARLFRAGDGACDVAEAPAGYERNDMFVAEMRTFLDVVAGKAVAEPTLADGIRSLQLALAILESARLGRRIDLAG
ncbi:MAG: Gfo/Idh/MocA family oxidoreductase, partial [Chloroflexi bacterium]|nr:Gfo/Idh/MocA family oxidoreductase [Chloroflexota bacterium]